MPKMKNQIWDDFAPGTLSVQEFGKLYKKKSKIKCYNAGSGPYMINCKCARTTERDFFPQTSNTRLRKHMYLLYVKLIYLTE